MFSLAFDLQFGKALLAFQGFPNSVKRLGELEILLGDIFLLRGGREGLHKEYFQSSKAFVMLKLIFHIYILNIS